MLLLLRHAEAEPAVASDHDRRLTAKGLSQCDRVAHWLRQTNLLPDLILTSPVIRALQTAEHVHEKLRNHAPALETPLVQPWLACGMRPEVAYAELAAFLPDFPTLLLVGHEPDLSHYIASALGMPHANALHIRKASLTALSHGLLRPGHATLEFCLPAKYMGKSKTKNSD